MGVMTQNIILHKPEWVYELKKEIVAKANHPHWKTPASLEKSLRVVKNFKKDSEL